MNCTVLSMHMIFKCMQIIMKMHFDARTSVEVRISKSKELHGQIPIVSTEKCDLGIRLRSHI